MELRSRRRPRSSEQQREDRINALPDDLLLLVLDRLRCAAAAERTGVLTRRWRSLWTRQTALVFRDVRFRSLEAVLGRIDSPNVSLLEICVPAMPWPIPEGHYWHWPDSAGLGSLLHAAAGLAPEEFVLTLPPGLIATSIDADLPCFQRATSIMLDSLFLFLGVLARLELPALETLTLSGCMVDLHALLSRCLPLRSLRLKLACSLSRDKHFTVQSTSLQELVMDTKASWIRHLDIVAPSLKQLTMCLTGESKVSISILAPMLEKVLWNCRYIEGSIAFGIWRLEHLRLEAAKRQGQLSALRIQACAVRPLSCSIYCKLRGIEKHMVVAFSVLELHLKTSGHVFGAFVFHLLGMYRIRCATRRLNTVLQKSLVKEKCPTDCPCEPTKWRSQTISLTALEEVEINGFEGGEHEIDCLKLIFKCAPIMLKTMIVKLSHEASASSTGCTQIYNISGAYPSVEFCVLP